MLKRLSTRNRAIMLSIFLTGLYFIFFSQTLFIEFIDGVFFGKFIFPAIIGMFMYLGIIWVLNFNIKGERHITVALFAASCIFIVSLFFEFLILNQTKLEQITTSVTSMVIVFVMNYVVILTMNILNYSYMNQIPLGQAGRAASYVLSLLIQYLAFFLLFSNRIEIALRFLFVFSISFYFTYSALWTLGMKLKDRVVSSAVIGAITLIFAIILNIWPISTYILCFVLSLILYVSLGVALEVKEVMGKYIWLEYGLLLAMVFFILSLVSDWGINGHLL